jgi:hypothetical protein
MEFFCFVQLAITNSSIGSQTRQFNHKVASAITNSSIRSQTRQFNHKFTSAITNSSIRSQTRQFNHKVASAITNSLFVANYNKILILMLQWFTNSIRNIFLKSCEVLGVLFPGRGPLRDSIIIISVPAPKLLQVTIKSGSGLRGPA